MTMRIAAVLFFVSALGCASSPSTQNASAPSSEWATPLDVQSLALIAFPEFQKVALTKDGKYIAISHLRNNLSTVSVLERATGKILTSKSFPKDIYITQMVWLTGERLIMTTVYSKGLWMKGERSVPLLYAMDFNGANDIQLFPSKMKNPGVTLTGNAFWITSNDLVEGTDLILSEIKASRMGHELMIKRVNIQDGRSFVVEQLNVGEDWGSMLADNQHIGRVAVREEYDERPRIYTKPITGGSWKQVEVWKHKSDSFNFIGFNKANDTFYFTARNESGFEVLYSAGINAAGKLSQVTELYAAKGSDINEVEWDQVNKEVVFAADSQGHRVYFAKSEYSQAVKALNEVFQGEVVRPVGAIDEGVLFTVESSSRPTTSYIFDWKSLSARKFLASNDKVDTKLTSKAEAFTFTARDGVKVGGYLYKPVTGKAPYPTIVEIHGGPYGIFETDRYDSYVQFFTNKGYAIMKVNYRGSGGRGRAFEELGYKKWGTAMQDDIADAALWAVKKGVADKDRVGLWGGSYGGYASAMSLLRFPDIFRCAVAINGVYDLRLKGQVGDTANSESANKFFDKTLPASTEERYKQSPVSLASTLKRPLYIMAGAEDDRVPVAHAEALTSELRKAGKEFQYKEYPNMGHWFRDQDMLNHAFNEMLVFFEKNLKPKLGTKTAGK